jgi:hypothetical protein
MFHKLILAWAQSSVEEPGCAAAAWRARFHAQMHGPARYLVMPTHSTQGRNYKYCTISVRMNRRAYLGAICSILSCAIRARIPSKDGANHTYKGWVTMVTTILGGEPGAMDVNIPRGRHEILCCHLEDDASKRAHDCWLAGGMLAFLEVRGNVTALTGGQMERIRMGESRLRCSIGYTKSER